MRIFCQLAMISFSEKLNMVQVLEWEVGPFKKILPTNVTDICEVIT